MNEFRSATDLPPDKAEIVEFMGWAAIFQVEAEKLKRQSRRLKAKAIFNVLSYLALLAYLYFAVTRMFADYQGATASQRYIAAASIGIAFFGPVLNFAVRDWRSFKEIEAMAAVMQSLCNQVMITNGKPASKQVKELIRSAAGWIEFKNRDRAQLRQLLDTISAEPIRSAQNRTP